MTQDTTKHIIIGTAGHVDHGKTTLIKALTGIDTDRLKEEQQRGMTIDLGFASFTLPSGRTVGIVDVPGHERFLKNMLAGASGIDLVVMVIAADEGVMPQTVEHLEILQLLETRKGVVALTKCDMVDPEWTEIVEDDVRQRLAGTFLENAPVVRVSGATSEGIPELVSILEKLCAEAEQRSAAGPFRLPIDRVFTLTGFGTVVTGTLVSGTIRVGDAVEVLPQGLHSRARQIQVHGKKQDEAMAGTRVAVNLAGVETSELERGSVCVPPGYLKPTLLMDAHVRLLKEAPKPLKSRMRVRLHIGTAEALGRVTVLGKDEIAPSGEGLMQFKSETPIVAARGDRFVIRSYSPMRVIGGGVVLEPNAARHKRFDQAVVSALEAKRQGDPRELVEQALLSGGALPAPEIAKSAGLSAEDAAQAIQALTEDGRLVRLDSGKLMHRVTLDTTAERILAALAEFHKANPLKPGESKEALRARSARGLDQKTFSSVLARLEADGKVAADGNTVRLTQHEIRLSPEQQKAADKLEAAFLKDKFNPPSMEEATSSKDIFDLLVTRKKLVKIGEGLYFHTDALAEAEKRIREYVAASGPMTVSAFRDLIGSSRKYVVPLLEYFDNKRVTRRVGDQRVVVG